MTRTSDLFQCLKKWNNQHRIKWTDDNSLYRSTNDAQDFAERSVKLYSCLAVYKWTICGSIFARKTIKCHSLQGKAFLFNWRQRVRINGINASRFKIQGPLLFINFINDLLENWNNGSELFLYADDAKLFRHISCDNDLDLLQKDLLDIQSWMEKWLLKLNIKM